ncbi:MAG TPA: hypothetical protein VK281_19315 [Xanthobacteraceae bacterium]|nr:hypothetical protein [Xanthobacteraceae bacterium]
MVSLTLAVGNTTRTSWSTTSRDTLSAALERADNTNARVHYNAEAHCNAEVPEGPRTASQYAACPSCGYDMTVITVTPTFLRDDYEDVNYECEKCRTQIHRQVKSKSVRVDRDVVKPAAQGRVRT